MAERNGISIFKGTSPQKRREILQTAHRLIGEKVFIETFLFNYRGRLLSINEDFSLNVLILASDEVFRKIHIDLPLIIEIGKISCKQLTQSDGNNDFSSDEPWSKKRYSITIKDTTSRETQRKIYRKAHMFEGQVVIIKTLLYDYVVCIIDANDSFITVRQLVDFNPQFVIKFRISTEVILDIIDIPK